jgi:DNA polymerase-3 subunit beta
MIHFDTATLLKPLAAMQSIVDRKTTIPVLSHVLIEDNGENTTIFASNREIELSWILHASGGHPFSCTLPAHKFYDLCRNLPSKTILALELQENRAILSYGKNRFVFNSFHKEDFPCLEHRDTFSTVTLPAVRFDTALARVQFAMASQDIRQYLNGMLFDFEGNCLKLVATDGHRLAFDEIVFTGAPLARQMIVPKKTVAELRKLLGGETEVSLKVGERLFEMKADGVCLKSTIIDGRYPDYQKVIPDLCPNLLHAERMPLLQALERCAIITKERNDGVLLSLSSEALIISARNTDQEEAVEELPVHYEGMPLEIAFNHSYLTEGLGHLTSAEIVFALQNSSSSAVLRLADKDDPYRYVMMPMRI